MTVPSGHEVALGLLMVGCAAFIAVVLYLTRPRRQRKEISEWSEDHYEPRRQEPRAVTRLTKDDITWEI